MTVKEKISREIEKLPESIQAEVLDFIEYLAAKTGGLIQPDEDRAWGRFSLAAAMRGMEDEETPGYTSADLKEPT